jgi:hypothetical protein
MDLLDFAALAQLFSPPIRSMVTIEDLAHRCGGR